MRTVVLFSTLTIIYISTARCERVTAKEIHPERELVITAPSIVDSAAAQYPGPWSFGVLLEQLVGPEKAGTCVREWLDTWNAKQKVNNQEIEPRYGIFTKVILPWQIRDGYKPDPEKSWEPQMRHAPFRLLAIVNRMDLCAPAVAGSLKQVEARWRMLGREKEFFKLLADDDGGGGNVAAPPAFNGYGFGCLIPGTFASKAPVTEQPVDTAGEGRFVFCAVDDAGVPLEGGWTIILEYKLDLQNGTTVRDWAKAWHGLSALEPGDPAFAAALEKVTRSFTTGKPTLAQLRTNEAAFGPGREFRQFELSGGTLSPTTLTQTPASAFSQKQSPEQRALSLFLHERDPLIRSGINRVPDNVQVRNKTVGVLAGSAMIPADEPNFYWDMDRKVSHETRHLFSLNTCNGCHGGETGCTGGEHIHPRAAGAEAVLSSFLRADRQPFRVDDPDLRGTRIVYEEMNDRAAILAALLEPNDVSTVNALHPILRLRLSRAH